MLFRRCRERAAWDETDFSAVPGFLDLCDNPLPVPDTGCARMPGEIRGQL